MGRKISLYISSINRSAAEQVLPKLTEDFEIIDYKENNRIAIKAKFDDFISKALRFAAKDYFGGGDTEPFVSSIIRSRRVEMQATWDKDYATTGIDDTGGGLISKDIDKLLFEIRSKSSYLKKIDEGN